MNIGSKKLGELPVVGLLRAWCLYVLTVTYIEPKLNFLSKDRTDPRRASKQNDLISRSWLSW